MNRRQYTALLHLLRPLLPLRLWWRGRRQPGYREHWRERFGRYEGAPNTAPLVWIHAVSVGETRAAEPLVRALLARHPERRVLLTHMTPTGRATGEQLFGERVLRAYLPYDYPGAVARFLDHFRPTCGLLMETEIWPNLIAAARERAIPVHLVNARLSARSHRRYARHRELAREALQGLAGVAAQTAADVARLADLGAPAPQVVGNLKFDIAPPSELVARGASWRVAFGRRHVLLAASTRPGEEAIVLEACAPLVSEDVLLIIVPRHPERCEAVAALARTRGLAVQWRSAGVELAAGTRVLIGDTLGEMFAYYAAADAVIMGGSLLDYGSQNLIEPCALGKPVLLGPSRYNFAEAAALALEAGAALSVTDAASITAALRRVMEDAGLAQRMSAAAQAFAGAHQGATQRLLELIDG